MSNNFKTYTKFSRHANNIDEVIDAEHVNKVQESINNAETNIATLADKQFVDKSLFTFDNNIYANCIFIDELVNLNYVDMEHSSNIVYDAGDRSISLKDGATEGFLLSSPISSEYSSIINDFIVMSDVYSPLGSDVKYFIATHNGDSYPVNANTPNIPFTSKNSMLEVMIKIQIKRNAQGESPKIYSWALMYFDYILEGTYGMINPDLRRFTQEQAGSTILVRDRANNDRLVRVIETNTITELFYDNETGKLDYTLTTTEATKIKDTLIYEPYLNSGGTIETVLSAIKTEPVSLENAVEPSVIFDDGQVTE